MNIDRGRVVWGGGPVIGGGVSTFYAVPGHSAIGALATFYDAIKALIPTTVGFTFPTSGDTIDSASGFLTGGWALGSTIPSFVGTGAGTFAAAAGAVVTWDSNIINPGKPPTNKPFKIRGRTFLVPMAGSAYDSQGVLTSSAHSTLQTAANALLTTISPYLGVWSRNTLGATNGVFAPILSARVPSRCAVLTSRRD